MKLRLAPATAKFIEAYSRTPSHAVLLTGPEGIGLHTLALHIARTNGTILADVRPESKTTALPSISVDIIRELYIQTKSRLNGLHFVIIDDADTMNHHAQNALLKLLEEPNNSICFVLTTHAVDKLLPTIRSRVQTFVVPRISTLDSKRLLSEYKTLDDVTIQRLLFVADGLPALLNRLTAGDADFKKMSERVQLAMQIVQGTPYRRLVHAISFAGDRQDSIALIETIIMVLRKSLSSQPSSSSVLMIERLLKASEAIRGNGSIKILLAAAMV